ncbi:hypothetical protein DV515_00009983 [Chloebia gouldiae]|uniref:Uncharacterized protein n=1 Tax=Chloebia gouldiae TaxID=44316 RepID=A0A3L8SAB2_CHLGU|nr:hypothetical protein DV515_00009983 [Chloebia gouldiae]
MPRKLLLPYKSVFSHFRAPRGLHDSLAMNAARSGYRVFSANSTAASTELAKKITDVAIFGRFCSTFLSLNTETNVSLYKNEMRRDVERLLQATALAGMMC